jgi:hypothetical protein
MNVCNRNLNLGNDLSSVMTVNSKVQRALPLVVLLGESQAWLPVVRAIQQTEQSAARTNPRTLMFGNSIKGAVFGTPDYQFNGERLPCFMALAL